jgi:hypothetical protein
MISTWWHHYWSWVGGNVGAMPLQALIAAIAGVAFRKPLRRAYHALVGEHADLQDVKRIAEAAHRISADLFEHHTGGTHPDAPPPKEDR